MLLLCSYVTPSDIFVLLLICDVWSGYQSAAPQHEINKSNQKSGGERIYRQTGLGLGLGYRIYSLGRQHFQSESETRNLTRNDIILLFISFQIWGRILNIEVKLR